MENKQYEEVSFEVGHDYADSKEKSSKSSKKKKIILAVSLIMVVLTIATVIVINVLSQKKLENNLELLLQAGDSVAYNYYNQLVDKGKREVADEIVCNYLSRVSAYAAINSDFFYMNGGKYDYYFYGWGSPEIEQYAQRVCHKCDAYEALDCDFEFEYKEENPISKRIYPYANKFLSSQYAEWLGNTTTTTIIDKSLYKITTNSKGESIIEGAVSSKYCNGMNAYLYSNDNSEELGRIKDSINDYNKANGIKSEIIDVAKSAKYEFSQNGRTMSYYTYAVYDGVEWYFLCFQII